MKYPLLIPLLSVAVLLMWTPSPAQTADDSSAETTVTPGSTVITSDELHSDQANHVSVFSGNVIVVGVNFRMTCLEMTVYFTNDNKVQRIVSTGDVVITQPDRVTHCGHAEYLRDTDTFDLTDQPVILDHKNKVFGPEIIIERTTQKMTVKGGRSTTVISSESMGSAPASTKTTTPSTEHK
jgi:lipopolysaccharide transport protein LptA